MSHAASPTTDLKDTLEAMRASVAARKGLAGAIEKAILGLLELLLALLADFRAGKLTPPAPASGDADGAGDGGEAVPATANQEGKLSDRGSRSRSVRHAVASRPGNGCANSAALAVVAGDAGRAPRFPALRTRTRRFGIVRCENSAALAAVAGYARHSPGCPTLRVGMQDGVEPADSKNQVLGPSGMADSVVAISKRLDTPWK